MVKEIIIKYDTERRTARGGIRSEKVGDLVRCLDCKHYDNGLCKHTLIPHNTEEDGYCSYGTL